MSIYGQVLKTTHQDHGNHGNDSHKKLVPNRCWCSVSPRNYANGWQRN